MRALASIRKIAEVRPIEGADMIVAYRVDGWWVVDKKEQYEVNDLAVYIEVDSWVPHDLAPFLSKGKEPRQYGAIKGERLRTVKLKGQLSQGLLLPGKQTSNGLMITRYPDLLKACFTEGEDVSQWLGVTKWEPPMPAQLAGQVRGNFPAEIPKTDQERIQNLDFPNYLGQRYEVTEKLHGSSCTFYLDMDGLFHVCSRNWDLKPDENNAYWKAAYKYKVEEEMKRLGLTGYAIQGELCGEGINGNNYKLGLDFFVFDIFKVDEGYLTPHERKEVTRKLGLKHVPVLDFDHHLLDDAEILLKKADGLSILADCKREGFVFKSHQSDHTFKVVSNAWLLKYE